MITVQLNKQLDIEVYKDFWNFTVAGADFGAQIKRDHPTITSSNYEAYIEHYYSEHATELEQSKNELTSALAKIEDAFYNETKNIFGVDFRNNSYTGFISIFDCNPRFINTHSFQVFYKRSLPEKVGIALHEILHFMFFTYCDTALPTQTGSFDKNTGKLWQLSEIFNIIVLNLPPFRNILGREEKLFYPNLATALEDSKRMWEESSGDISKFIVHALSKIE